MKLLPKRLYGQLVFLVSIIIVTVIMMYGWFNAHEQLDHAMKTTKSQLEAISRQLAVSCANYLVVSDYAAMETFLLRTAEFPPILRIEVIEKNGNVLGNVVRALGQFPKADFSVKSSEVPSSHEKIMEINRESIVSWQPILAGNLVGWIKITYSMADIRQMQKMIWRNTAIAVILGILLSFVLLMIVLRRPVFAIKKVTDFAGRLSETKGETMLVQHHFTELEHLCETLNYVSRELYENEKELLQHRDHLKDLVDLRTRELKRIAEELEIKNKELEQAYGELKSAQFKMIQQGKMASVGQFAAGIAHEINNPLGVIIGFTQSMIRRMSPGNSFEMPLKSIEREATRCKNIVQDLLTFSRFVQSNRESMDLNKAVESALSLIGVGMKTDKIEINKKLSPEILPVLGNQNQIQQVVIDLTNNAIDAMPEGGILTISTEMIEKKSQSWVCLKVSDTGNGIPAEIQPKIFEPFFTTKPVGEGTGLGLSICCEILNKHNAVIEFETEQGKGTTFKVCFPPEKTFSSNG